MAQDCCKKDSRKEDKAAAINLANSSSCSIRIVFFTDKT